MLNIPINLNMLNPTQLDTNTANNSNQKTNDLGDFMNIEFNTDNSNKITNKVNTDLSKIILSKETNEMSDIVSSFENILNVLTNKDEEVSLNEDISFLQSIMTILNYDSTVEAKSLENTIDNIEALTSSNSISSNIVSNNIVDDTLLDIANTYNHSNTNSLVNLERAVNNIEHYYKGLDLNEPIDFKIIDTNLVKDLEVTKEALIEFTNNIDESLLLELNKIDDIQMKKDALIETFKEFVLEYNSSEEAIDASLNLEDSYDSFKANLKLSIEKNDSFKANKFDSLKTTEMIEILNSDISKTNNIAKPQETVHSNLKETILRYDMFSEDLESTLIQMKNHNMKQLKIKLSPKELGDMTIDLSQLNNTSTIKLTISNPETLELVKSNIQEVINHLKENQIISDSSNVNVEADTSQRESFSSNFESFSSNQSKKGHNTFNNGLDEVSINEINEIHKNQDNILNILA